VDLVLEPQVLLVPAVSGYVGEYYYLISLAKADPAAVHDSGSMPGNGVAG